MIAARGKAFDAFGADQVAAREAVLIQTRALVTATPSAFEGQRRLIPVRDDINVAHAHRIERMRLRDTEPATVVFRASARCSFDG